MRTYLFTWEIGQGFGHIFKLLLIARELKAQGSKIVFALRDVRTAGDMLRKEGMEVLQAPTHPDQFFPSNGPQPQSMADVLAIFGFANKKNLAGLAAAWHSLISLVKPDVVVANYAPLSLLCAKQVGIPSAVVCVPFEIPPKIHPVPPFRPHAPSGSSKVDDRVISTVNAVFGESAVSAVYEIFDADKTFFATFPELDPFGPRADVNYVGSLFVSEDGADVKWPQGNFPFRVLGYLNPGLPALDELRQEIQASPYAYSIIMRDADEKLLARWAAPNVHITAERVALNGALFACDAVLNYGGIGFASACLFAGKPMVFHVRQLEQYLTAQQIVKMGAGLHAQPQSPKAAVEGIRAVLMQPQYREAAQRFAASHPDFMVNKVAHHLAQEINQLAER